MTHNLPGPTSFCGKKPPEPQIPSAPWQVPNSEEEVGSVAKGQHGQLKLKAYICLSTKARVRGRGGQDRPRASGSPKEDKQVGITTGATSTQTGGAEARRPDPSPQATPAVARPTALQFPISPTSGLGAPAEKAPDQRSTSL
jgi:hypothetical protein